MTPEDKDLLLQDLCARLPYGLILNCCNLVGEKLYTIDSNGLVNNDYDLEEVKPYLFPLSSMTEEQRYELQAEHSKDTQILLNVAREVCVNKNMDKRGLGITHYAEDWCNKNHFDYRGLIPMGLANDATGLNIY